MPGIVGLITKMPRRRAEEQLHRMLAVLCHENFYTTGTWVDESLGVYVGWVARKDSSSNDMPVRNERADMVLVFSGEDFPEDGTRSRLQNAGHSFEPNGLSYLVHLAEEDVDFPRALNGWFQGILTDLTRGTVTLFNDRFGMHRIYYYDSPDAFYFSVEAKAILSVRAETRNLDPKGLGEFVTCGFPHEERTLFRGIRTLPGASAWVFRGGVLDNARKYFDPKEWEGRDLLSPEEYYQEIKDAFSRNLPRYFSGDPKVAMSLTGGLDGRMIMAWHRAAPGTLPCYTFGGMFRESRDVSLARQVAQACGQPHAVIEVGREFLSQFPTYAERTIYLTDGCVEVSHSPDLYAHVKARGIAPVRMTGNYGGEVLRGVWSFRPWEPPHGLFQEEFVSYIHQARMAYGSRNGKQISEVIFKEIPAHLFGQFALDQTQITLRSPYFDNELIRAVLRGSRHGSVENSEICHRLVLEGNGFLNEIPLDRKQRGKGLLAISRGQVLEFLFKAEYGYDAGMPNWMARLDRAFSWFNLEQLFLGRHKWYHFRTWYKGALSGYVREMLLDERTLSRPYINRHSLDAIVKGHLSGDGNYTAEIHKILTIELIQRRLIET